MQETRVPQWKDEEGPRSEEITQRVKQKQKTIERLEDEISQSLFEIYLHQYDCVKGTNYKNFKDYCQQTFSKDETVKVNKYIKVAILKELLRTWLPESDHEVILTTCVTPRTKTGLPLMDSKLKNSRNR
jgi:hypothetical protein